MVWDLHRRYDTELRRLGVHDLADIVRLAVAASPPDPPYSLVAVDECQDLDLVSLRLVAALAGEPSRLLLVGDGRQALQPGGVRLLDAGIDVRGRSRTLPTCYRTTRQVLALARTFVEGDDELGEDGDLEVTGIRDGDEPLRVTAPTSRDLEIAVVQRVRDALAGGVPPGDVAVLLRRRVDVERWTGLLHRAGVPVAPLTRYAVGERGCVWVGTYQRSKGLEFGVVVLPAVERPQVTEGMDPAQAEETQRRRRELHVAMTRARDTLVLGEILAPEADVSRPAAVDEVAPVAEDAPPACPTACAEPLR